jgi:hypothetical protein
MTVYVNVKLYFEKLALRKRNDEPACMGLNEKHKKGDENNH